MKKWCARNDLQGLCKWFGTPKVQNGLFWHNRDCVKFHQNDEISLAPACTSLLEFRFELPSQMEFIWSVKNQFQCTRECMTQSRYSDPLMLNQIEPNLFWRVYRLCWSQPQPQMCQMLLDDTTTIVSTESNQTIFCHADMGNGFYISCTVSWQNINLIEVTKHWQNSFKCLNT